MVVNFAKKKKSLHCFELLMFSDRICWSCVLNFVIKIEVFLLWRVEKIEDIKEGIRRGSGGGGKETYAGPVVSRSGFVHMS